jgi:peptide/nickel transport system substrate-binding protein
VGGLIGPTTLNPLLADDEASLAVTGLVFGSLLVVDPWTGALLPNLARAWQVSADGLTITFDLRDDVLWHDGEPFAAEDVEFTFQAIANTSTGLSTGLGADSPHRFDLALVEEFQASDTKTFLVKLSEPSCSALYDLGLLPIVPRHVLPQQAMAIGTGPFVFGEWLQDDHITLIRNTHYWRGASYLDAWTYRVLADAEQLLAELEAGHVDVAYIRPGDLARIEATGHFEIHRYPAAEGYFIAFNNDHPVLGDERVRQALSYALDRERIVDQVLLSQGTLLATGLLPGHWVLQGSTGPRLYDYDSGEAQRLLAEAGWSDSDGDGILDRDGEPFQLSLTTNAGNATREAIAILAGQYYRAIGVVAQVELVEWGNLLGRMFSHTFDAVVLSWPLELDPDQREFWHCEENALGSGFNFVSYCNPYLDDLLIEGAAMPNCDSEQRAEIYGEMASILAEDRPYDFLFAPDRLLAANQRVVGPDPSPFAGLYWNVMDWYVTR